MLRTIFMTGLFALIGLFLLRIAFGILGGLFGIVFGLLGLAIKIAIIGAIVYIIIRIFMPETAARLRGKWSGENPSGF